MNELTVITKSMLRKKNKKITAEIKTIKYYFGKSDSLLLNNTTVKNMLNSIISYISKEDIHYDVLINIYEEITGEKYYEQNG